MKKYIALSLVLTLVLGLSITAEAATSKTGNIVTGAEVLQYITDYVPTAEDMEKNGVESELAIVIQTREVASQPRHGFTVINYGAVLSEDGKADGSLPRLTTKKNRRKNSYKYITEISEALFMQEFTNTNEEYGIYQKKEDKDAYKETTVYYGAIGADGKKQVTATNVAGLYDKANAQYIYTDRNFFKYEIKDPEKDEVIGYMFIEQKR